MNISEAERPVGYSALAYAIVEQAVEDWEKLDEGKQTHPASSYQEIEHFLLSDYCDFLLQNSKFTGREILNALKLHRDQTAKARKTKQELVNMLDRRTKKKGGDEQ